MTLTTHAALGVLVADTTTSPLLGLLAAIISHYLADILPHGDEFLYWRYIHNPQDAITLFVASVDLFGVIILILAIINLREAASAHDNLLAVFGALGGILPDLLVTLHTKQQQQFKTVAARGNGRIRNWYHKSIQAHYRFHMFFHNLVRTPIRFRTGIAYQAIFLGIFFYYFV